jgi:hypothetical protein
MNGNDIAANGRIDGGYSWKEDKNYLYIRLNGDYTIPGGGQGGSVQLQIRIQ